MFHMQNPKTLYSNFKPNKNWVRTSYADAHHRPPLLMYETKKRVNECCATLGYEWLRELN